MIRKLKDLFYKRDINYSEGIIDPYKFHKTFYIFSRNFNVLDNEPTPKWTKLLRIFFVIATIFMLVVAMFAFYHAIIIRDLSLIAECGTYNVVLAYLLLILASTKMNIDNYHRLMCVIREDFHFICTEGQRYRSRFFENQLLTWQYCFILLAYDLFTGVVIVSVSCLQLVYFLMTHMPGDGGKRTLSIPFWFFDVDFSETPYFEVLFICTICIVVISVTVYSFKVLSEIVWIRQITAKADVVNYLLEDLSENIYPATNTEERGRNNELLTNRLRKIGAHLDSMYNLMNDYAVVFKKFLMLEQKLAPVVITMTAYATSINIAEGKLHVMLILLCLAAIAVMFVPSALCTFLGTKVHSIADACLYCKFWITGPVVRPYLVLFIQRSLRPLPLQAAGFQNVSLETFFSKMGSSYSMFNMLRQTNL